MKRDLLVGELTGLLKPHRFKDYCPNGLQVEGSDEVHKIVAGVTASEDLIQAAIEQGADTLLVHHGYFWRGEPAAVTGMKAKRMGLLLAHNINLIAYHLPLDAHPVVGNNAQLGALLGFETLRGLDREIETSVGLIGETRTAMQATQIAQIIEQRLGRKPLLVGPEDQSKPIKSLAWCTGAAQNRITDAAEQGVDLYISGEISEPTYHAARELGVYYIAAGHHATERYGVQALGQWIEKQFSIEQVFVDIDNPV